MNNPWQERLVRRMNASSFKVGDIVKFRSPNADESADSRMRVVELRGDRVLVQDQSHAGMLITPTAVYLIADLVKA